MKEWEEWGAWGEWQYEGMPSLGAYVQVETEHAITGSVRTYEGLVVRIKGTIITLTPIPLDTHFMVARRWRERVLPEFNKSAMWDETLA